MQIETHQLTNPDGVTITVSNWGSQYNEGLHQNLMTWMKSQAITMADLRKFLLSFGEKVTIQRGARVVIGYRYAPLHEILSAMTNTNIQLVTK
jgi:hypothetical protein